MLIWYQTHTVWYQTRRLFVRFDRMMDMTKLTEKLQFVLTNLLIAGISDDACAAMERATIMMLRLINDAMTVMPHTETLVTQATGIAFNVKAGARRKRLGCPHWSSSRAVYTFGQSPMSITLMGKLSKGRVHYRNVKR